MHLFFGDDSRQIRPTRSKMGPLVAAGGFLVEGKAVKSLEGSLNDVCQKAGFPANDEFKWSPGRELWMRSNLIGDARREFYFDVLSTAADHEIVAMVFLEDVKCRTATRAKTHEDDVSHVLLERVHNALPFDCDVCIVIVDRPTGDRSSEDRFSSHCLEDLQSGTEYVQHDKIALNEVTAPCLKPFVFFGSSSGDECWGINWQNPNEIITYHHHMGDEYETVGTNILEVWKADYALYDEIDE